MSRGVVGPERCLERPKLWRLGNLSCAGHVAADRNVRAPSPERRGKGRFFIPLASEARKNLRSLLLNTGFLGPRGSTVAQSAEPTLCANPPPYRRL